MMFYEIPPWAYRYLSKSSMDEIVAASKLSKSTVIRISRLQSFNSVKLGVVKQYIAGCGFDSFNPPARQWMAMCEGGLKSVKHRQPRKSDKLWMHGARANSIKFIKRVIAG
jgi:hypothetical protein